MFKTFVCKMKSSFDLKLAFCFAVKNSVAAIALVSNARQCQSRFFRKHIFQMKMVYNFRWIFENDF